MSVVVVDASALAALLFGEPAAAEVVSRLEGAALVAPTLLPYELASVCLKKSRRDARQAATLRRALGGLSRLPLRLVEVGPRAALDAATTSGLTVYDGAYLWLARLLAAPLVTLDRALERAADGG